MNKLREIPWPRILAESAAIVVSILLAFGIEAWWEARQESSEENAILLSLLEAFEEKRIRLATERRQHEAILESTRYLLNAALSQADDFPENELNERLADIWWVFDETDWRMAILEGLIDSGDISFISNSDLRRGLGEWPLRLERVQLYYRDDKNYYFRRMEPYLISNGFLPAIANQETHVPGFPDQMLYTTKYQFQGPSQNTSMLKDVEFQNILVEKTYRNENTLLIAFDGLDEALDEIIGMIQSELRE